MVMWCLPKTWKPQQPFHAPFSCDCGAVCYRELSKESGLQPLSSQLDQRTVGIIWCGKVCEVKKRPFLIMEHWSCQADFCYGHSIAISSQKLIVLGCNLPC